MATIKITRDNKFHCGQFIEDEGTTVRFQKTNAEVHVAKLEEVDGNVKMDRSGGLMATELVEED